MASRELREDSAMLLNAWKSTGSDFFFPFCVSPFQRALESSSGVLSRWNWIARGSGAGLGKAAPSLSIQCTEAETSEVQRPTGPELQSNIPEEAQVETRGYSTIDKFYIFYSSLFLSFWLDLNKVNVILRTSYPYIQI